MVESLLPILDPSSFILMEVSLKGFFDWFKQQAEIVLFIILLALLIVTIVRRAWVQALGILVGLMLLGIFIWKPSIIMNLSKWLAGKLSLT